MQANKSRDGPCYSVYNFSVSTIIIKKKSCDISGEVNVKKKTRGGGGEKGSFSVDARAAVSTSSKEEHLTDNAD